MCKIMKVSTSAFYSWQERPAKVISVEELQLYRRCKELFKQSRESLGSRMMAKKLQEEGVTVGRYRARSLMRKLGLKVRQRIAYKVTTKRKHHHEIADNLLNQQFNPMTPNVAWAGDVTYLRTNEGWMYLAIVMDLYSRKIIGCSINKRMTTPLVMSAMEMAINLRQPGEGVLFHSDRGSQYTSKKYRKLLSKHKIEASMSSVGACLDNAPVERFFGSLKNEWLLNVVHLTRESMAEDVKAYIRYYNHDRLHTANEYLSPVNFENSRKKVSCLT
ncbi:putative transposase OrfB [Piscirickettsia salmonis]|nr:putative transposase OrfB [Piscirickettsia salmonis]QGP53206.1 putative transposase OrfB [Piscirickettsia salmonis]QGP53214.1 putative transposase OrfB [Piscirickettsia salmonis]QGP54197.1 putative transposase OrfB [Piscirickettsia salmonis]QGP59907.1 putative transposase OrfB [Piscirickettsia salmonis]